MRVMPLVLLPLLAALAGAWATQPSPAAVSAAASVAAHAVATPATDAGSVVALRDALRTLAPVLGDSPDADEVRTALHAVALQRAVGPGADAPTAERTLHAALDRLERRDPTRGPEIDAIRGVLALDDRPSAGR